MKNKIVIAGGSGFIGKVLSSYYKKKGYLVVILTRGTSRLVDGIRFEHWDAKTLGDWSTLLEGAEVLINLTGKSVDCRYTKENKRLILSSRVDATNVLGEAINQLQNPPKVWFNSSTATIYDYSLTKAMTEEDGDIGSDFSMSVAKAWEEAFFNSTTPKTRKIALRISLVLGKGEGVLPVLTKLSKLGLGGYHGNGKQKFAWIHIDDLIQTIEFLKGKESIDGPINCTSPSEIDNQQFMKALRKSLGVWFGIPTPKFALEIGSFLMQTESELILKSRFVKPQRLLDNGFQFKFTNIDKALADLK
ncbi:MAG: TIGR01777 family protein [Flavobacteriales bacterium]|nr:MAG: TIGR01777 family protein [Flavobacteriales bacterium]